MIEQELAKIFWGGDFKNKRERLFELAGEIDRNYYPEYEKFGKKKIEYYYKTFTDGMPQEVRNNDEVMAMVVEDVMKSALQELEQIDETLEQVIGKLVSMYPKSLDW